MYQNDPMKCLTGEVRLSYVHLTTPRQQMGSDGTPQGDPKYQVTLLIPKTDTATKADMDAAFEAAAADGVKNKWGGLRPMLKSVIHDGDGVRESGMPFGPECKGHWVVTATTKTRPQVVGIDNVRTELAPDDVYSGMYARVTVRFFSYTTANKRGVGCGLNNVLKTRDGDRLSGGSTAAEDFADIAAAAAQARINPLTGLPF